MTSESTTPPPPKPLKFSQKLALSIGPFLIATFLRVMFWLNRNAIIKGENIIKDLFLAKEPILVAIWHENAAMLIPKFAQDNIHALASRSRDGEIGARMVKHFGVDCVRGSSSKGGSEALSEIVKVAPNVKALGITVDGPRGPRRKTKPGIVILSQRTGYPIIPVAASATKTLRAKSWDRMCIPLPFGKYLYAIGDPIAPAASDDRAVIAAKMIEVDEKMNALQDFIESEYGIDPQMTPQSED